MPQLFLLPRNVKNLARQPFGELTPVSIVEISPRDGAVWLCNCSCGLTRNVCARALIRGDVTRCEACARKRRTLYLVDAKNRSLARSGDSSSDYQRNWREHAASMTTEQRAELSRMIAARRRLGVEITEAVCAGLVEVVMIESRKAA